MTSNTSDVPVRTRLQSKVRVGSRIPTVPYHSQECPSSYRYGTRSIGAGGGWSKGTLVGGWRLECYRAGTSTSSATL
eukprot:scaffold426741_cov33-Prasinocladus_malaysianus.AAC.1